MDFVTTGDGSQTLYNALVGEHYHSKHGALQESKHVFLKSGLEYFLERNAVADVSVLEIGFGTGLNFLLTGDYCNRHGIKLDYCGIEAYPLPGSTIANMGYDKYVPTSLWDSYIKQYTAALAGKIDIEKFVSLQIAHTPVMDFNTCDKFDVVYFDAFAAIHQPEMWTDDTLAHVTGFMKSGGVFVTYAITGNLKRSMKALGFAVEKAPGAPGKREMLRAIAR